MSIVSFKHKELENLAKGKTSKINEEHHNKLRRVLTVLNHLTQISDLSNCPPLQPHPLDGKLKGHFSIKINGNWRVTFKFKNGNVKNVNYVDYH